MADYVDYEEDDFEDLAGIMADANMDDVTSTSGDTNEFKPLPDGSYLCEVEKAILKRTKDGKPMVSFTFKTVADGIIAVVGDDGESYMVRTPHTTNRRVFKNWVMDSKEKVEKFASNMLKFEGDELNVPLLEKEYFTTPLVLRQALAILEGVRIYTSLRTTEKNGQSNTWVTLVQWQTAIDLGLDEVPEAE